jgi:hypothetical protein
LNGRLDKPSEQGAPWLAFLRSRLRRPLSFYLAALLLVAIVPSFVFSMIILKRSTDEQERVIAALLKGTTGAVTRVVEREIDSMLTTLKVLSTATPMDTRNLGQLYERASSALRQRARQGVRSRFDRLGVPQRRSAHFERLFWQDRRKMGVQRLSACHHAARQR